MAVTGHVAGAVEGNVIAVMGAGWAEVSDLSVDLDASSFLVTGSRCITVSCSHFCATLCSLIIDLDEELFACRHKNTADVLKNHVTCIMSAVRLVLLNRVTGFLASSFFCIPTPCAYRWYTLTGGEWFLPIIVPRCASGAWKEENELEGRRGGGLGREKEREAEKRQGTGKTLCRLSLFWCGNEKALHNS